MVGEQGWHSGDSAHLPPKWMVEFAVGSCPFSKGFSPATCACGLSVALTLPHCTRKIKPHDCTFLP